MLVCFRRGIASIIKVRLISTVRPDTSGADSFSTFLPPGQWDQFRQIATDRRVSLIQGLAQSIQLWLDTNPAPDVERPEITRRIVVCNQKGGVGKTAITAGLGEALAEDPNTLQPVRIAKALTKALRASETHADEAEPTDSPIDIENLPGPGQHVLLVDFDPQCHLTNQLAALERALAPIEGDYDVIIVDCPPRGCPVTSGAVGALAGHGWGDLSR
ncbi:ParA family protein [Streptomyces bungoensis]|uniref:ParA family protein n=1 Tax=Streptomyces bungoensis TaxID=285568 RepID=UPI0036933E74